MINRTVFDELPDILAGRIQKTNEYMLKKVGEHINKIGQLTSGDLHRIEELRRASVDIRDIERALAGATNQNVADIREMLEWVAVSNYESAEAYYNYRGKEYIPLAENDYMQDYISSVAKRTADTMINLSQTTALHIWKSGEVYPVSFAKGYKEIVDQAVTNVTLGTQDFHSAMRNTLRTLGESGLRTVEYESGYTRRLDSSVRMNLLEGIRQVNQGIQDRIGEEIGADGVEISAHGFCAPDHAYIQGRQMSKEAYEKWTKEHEYPKRKIGVLNCHHFAYSIILGVNEPAYSEEQLAKLNRRNEEGVTFEGRHYTGYEATQVQRQLETEMRKAKDTQILAKASGDDVMRREAQKRINLLQSKYKQFSDAAGLPYKANRASVSGYHRVSEVPKKLTKSQNDVKIISGGISGARNPNGERAQEHATQYYESVRSMKTDVKRIAKTTGFSEKEIQRVKDFIFNDVHDLGGPVEERFAPDFMMAESWRRLINGTPRPHDITLIWHELEEMALMEQGYHQTEAHIRATQKYNYSKEANEFYDKITKFKIE